MGCGIYGLSLPDLAAAQHLLVRAPPHWQPWRVVRRQGVTRQVNASIDSYTARLTIAPGGSVVIYRASQTSVFTMPRPPSDAELAHPYLAATAAIVARWQGWQSFHAGGFVLGDHVWGVLGDRGLGKSTLLAALADQGIPVVSDDVLVVRNGRVMAGPRCIDLREQSAAALRIGQNIGLVGSRERWRIPIAAVDAELPLAGWIVLNWASDVGLEVVAPAARLPLLLDNLTVVLDPPDPPALLDLASLPMVNLHRPRRIDALFASVEMLYAHLPLS